MHLQGCVARAHCAERVGLAQTHHAPGAGAGCPRDSTPAVLRALYGVGNATARPGGVTRQCVAGFAANVGVADLQAFFAEYWPASLGQALTLVGPHNATAPAGGEANLDAQYVMAIGGGVNTCVCRARLRGRAPRAGGSSRPRDS